MIKLKPLQWFIDRIGKAVFRDRSPWYSENEAEAKEIGVYIHDELQAQYMFDMQNDIFHDTGVNLNYRDEKW